MSAILEKSAVNLARIRDTRPLIHNITNFVVMNLTANVLLSLGAAPVMAHAEEEVEEMVAHAGALVLNIGTLSKTWVSSMLKAGERAAELDTPIVLDPVGSGATAFRTAAATRIIDQCRVSIIRGNSSEVLSLGTAEATTRGVDAVHTVDQAAGTAAARARELSCMLAVTGPVDLVTDGDRFVRVENGAALMASVTGTGCSASAVIGAFAAVEPDPVAAAVGGLAFFGLAGERAAARAAGPGSFISGLLDELYNLTPETLLEQGRVVDSLQEQARSGS